MASLINVSCLKVGCPVYMYKEGKRVQFDLGKILCPGARIALGS